MELTSAPADAPGPAASPTHAPAGTSADAPVHFFGLDLDTDAPELMVPRSEVFSSIWDGGSDKEDLA